MELNALALTGLVFRVSCFPVRSTIQLTVVRGVAFYPLQSAHRKWLQLAVSINGDGKPGAFFLELLCDSALSS